MELDDTSHFLVYNALGIPDEEGMKIDVLQNQGRFLYQYAGAFLEEATVMCLKFRYPEGERRTIPNTSGTRPKRFEIDFVNVQDAIEIKWRDATTDGDHVAKEMARARAIRAHGFRPIRVMYCHPNRKQAIRIQERLKSHYEALAGDYYAGAEARNFVYRYTGVDLQGIIREIAQRNGNE